MAALNGQDILNRFYLQVDDSSQLSSEEALALWNEVYADIQNDRDWEWLKTTYTGTQSTSVPYVDLPADFRNICPNYMGNSGYNSGNMGYPVWWTGDWYNPSASGASSSIVFVGSTFIPYQVVPFSSRRSYRNMNNLCYIDFSTNRLYFIVQPTSPNSIEFDYIKMAPDLTFSTTPLFSQQFHEVIPYWMAAKFDPMQLTDKAQSYQRENTLLYKEALSWLRMLDANQKTQLA